MNNELLLLSKSDIPFREAQVNIHQPTIKEISLIGEESFHIGCQFLNFSINSLSYEDKINLENRTDFEVFMSIMNSKEKARYRVDSLLVLTLLFPEYRISIGKDKILLQKEDFQTSINDTNYDSFKDILVSMFNLNEAKQEGSEYNPADAFAARIAEKIKGGQRKVAQSNGEGMKKIAIFSRFISVLAVGESKDMNDLMNYSVFQLKDEFRRFQLKQDFDIYLEAKMAGAKDLEDVDNWMEDIHS